MMSKEAYTTQVRKELKMLGVGKKSWVRPRENSYDVVIIGAGQSGMGAAFGLLKEGIDNILLLDENEAGDEGPWGTYARMITLRTPKTLLSIDLGVPSLTFQSYWTALHGEDSWEAIDKIPRLDWLAYLNWFRDVLELPVENGVSLRRIEVRTQNVYALHLNDEAGDRVINSRKVVLATGIQGGGQWHTPDFIKKTLPKSRYAHTSEQIDFDLLKGKSIGILGGGASAFDNAQYALKAGVGSVDLFMRRAEIPSVNPIRFMEQTGVIPRYPDLEDALKYNVMSAFIDRAQPPTNDTFQRAASWPNFTLHLGAPWNSVKESDQNVRIETPKGAFNFDYLILSTGLKTEHGLRPELSDFADKIACWGDKFVAPKETKKNLLDEHPYLGSGFEFLPKKEKDQALLAGIYAFNYSALLSHGMSAAALSGLGHAVPRLVKHIANALFQESKEDWLTDYLAYDEPEFISEWRPTDKIGITE